MYFIILAITVFINVTLVTVPQDRPVFVTKIVKGRKCGHAKKKRVLLALWFVYSSCVPRLFYARFIGLSFWEASSPLSSESILGTETSVTVYKARIREMRKASGV